MAYLERVTKAGLELAKRFPGTVSHPCVQHDNWCSLTNGTGPCICNPDILVLCEGERFEVDAEGNLVEPRPGLICWHIEKPKQ